MNAAIRTRLAYLARFVGYYVIAIGLLFLVQGPIFVALVNLFKIPEAFQRALEPRTMALSELVLLIVVVIATQLLGFTERRAFWTYGFSRTADAVPRYFEGVAYGIGAPLLVAIFMLGFGGFKISGFALHGSDWFVYPVLWLIVMLMVGFTEELAFRGYPLFAFDRVAGFWPAAIVTTLLFGAAHLSKPGENAVDIGSIIFIGLFACFTLWRTGSLWLAAGFHFAFDFMQFFVIGTRNGSQEPIGHLFNATFPGPAWINGGQLGTEASYFIFPVTILLFAVVNWLHPRPAFRLVFGDFDFCAFFEFFDDA